MWEAHSKRYGTIYFSSKYPSVLRRFYENHGTQLLAQKVLARDKNTPQDILEKLYESGNEEVRLEIAGNDSVPIPVVLKMLDLPNNLAFRENLAYRRNLPQDIISRLFHDNSKSVRQTIIQFQPLDLDLMNKILKKKNITELGLLAENRNTPIFIQDSILAIPAPPKSWGVNGDYYLKEIQKKARLGIAQNKRASAGLLEDLYNEISSGRLLSDSDLGEAIAEHPNTSKSVLADIYSRFGEKYPRIKEAIEKRSDFTEKKVEQEAKDDNTGNVVLKQFSNVLLSADTESQRLATDAALEGLKRAGVPVEVVSDEQAAVMLGEQKGVELSAKQKRALETASPAMQDHHTVVSSADGTKVLKDLDNTIEEDLKITDHVQFMKTPSGTLYGWTVGGKIYLTKDGLNPNTPIHEYTHLWARAMKERNKEGWQSVKELLRDTPVWDEVLKDKNYQDILDDEDAIASEALSRISGKKNAEKMEAEARKMIDEAKDYVDKAKAISLLERMRSALKKFWNWVGKDLFGIKKFSSVDEITDRVLYDLTNGTDLKGAASEKVEKQQVSTGSEEEHAIIEHAKESGTYMKAPNGKPTRLTEKQWAQVRTKAFKSWFGDWEKAARIEKLRKSEPVVITGEEIVPSDELKQYKRNALEYGKTLRGEYTNEDTKETIALTGGNSRGGIREILQHDYKDIEHLQSIAAIPQIIEKSTYIDEAPNEDVEKYPGIKSFRYYVCGLKIGNNDYTVKAVIAVQNNGDRYYDHKLSSIEKGKLLSIIPTIQEAGIEDNLPLSIGKDRRLLSILQTNSSKVVDENGEPLVVHHSTDNEFDTFSKEKLGENTDQNASDDSVAATAHIGFWFNTNDLTGTLFQERDVAGYLDVKEPYEFNSLESLVEDMSYYSSAEEFVDRLKEDGYDGIVVRKDEEMGGTSYIAFEPNQIKSATDNNGEFSQESDDIRYRESKDTVLKKCVSSKVLIFVVNKKSKKEQ